MLFEERGISDISRKEKIRDERRALRINLKSHILKNIKNAAQSVSLNKSVRTNSKRDVVSSSVIVQQKDEDLL